MPKIAKNVLQFLKKKESDNYYSIYNIAKEDYLYRMLIGERSNGKTYSVLEYALKNYVNGKGKLGIIRRWDEDFKAKRGASLFCIFIALSLTDARSATTA